MDENVFDRIAGSDPERAKRGLQDVAQGCAK